MSTQHAIVPPGEAAAPAAATSRARTTIVAAILVLGAVAVATVLLWHPGPPRDDFSYASMAPVRNATWFVALLDAIGYVAVTVALAVAACLLAPARGARWANTGAVFTALGGIAFGVGDFAYGVLGWYATSNALSADAGSRLTA
jgi:hypothetical protein